MTSSGPFFRPPTGLRPGRVHTRLSAKTSRLMVSMSPRLKHSYIFSTRATLLRCAWAVASRMVSVTATPQTTEMDWWRGQRFAMQLAPVRSSQRDECGSGQECERRPPVLRHVDPAAPGSPYRIPCTSPDATSETLPGTAGTTVGDAWIGRPKRETLCW